MNSVAIEGDTITSPSQTFSSSGSTLVGNSLCQLPQQVIMNFSKDQLLVVLGSQIQIISHRSLYCVQRCFRTQQYSIPYWLLKMYLLYFIGISLAIKFGFSNRLRRMNLRSVQIRGKKNQICIILLLHTLPKSSDLNFFRTVS